MSKVFSFRLNDENPREAQAGEVIKAWAAEGYSLRQVVVEALVSSTKERPEQGELSSVVEQLQDLILSLDNRSTTPTPKALLSNSFLDAMKNSVKLGLSIE
jgi:hypothetical protein